MFGKQSRIKLKKFACIRFDNMYYESGTTYYESLGYVNLV
jgi:hypothetical protein